MEMAYRITKVVTLFIAVFVMSVAFFFMTARDVAPSGTDPAVGYFMDDRVGICYARSAVGMAAVPCTQEVRALIVFRGSAQ